MITKRKRVPIIPLRESPIFFQISVRHSRVQFTGEVFIKLYLFFLFLSQVCFSLGTMKLESFSFIIPR